jgi:hypothetical protein
MSDEVREVFYEPTKQVPVLDRLDRLERTFRGIGEVFVFT